MLWLLRFLALGHFAWSGVLLLIAGWSALSPFLALSYVSTGSNWSRLPVALEMATMHALPLAVLGVWMSILGRRLWMPGPQLRTTLLWTHGILLVLGSLVVVIGVYSVEAAEISSARGGGLLSPYAYLPLLFGVPVLVLAICSLVVALVGLHPYRPGSVLPEDAYPPVLTWGGKNALVVLSLLLLLACALAIGLRSLWPTVQHQETVEHLETMPARTRVTISRLRAIPQSTPRESKAFLRSAIMNGRLDVMVLADREATLALVASNIPTAFECIDILEIERDSVMAQIGNRSGPRSMELGEIEDQHLDVVNRMHGLLLVLKGVQHIQAGLEPFLTKRANGKGIARPVAISLIGKLDLPVEQLSRLLLSYVANGDEEAVRNALPALARLGAQAAPVVEELKRVRLKYRSNPATTDLARSVAQTVREIEKQVKMVRSGFERN